MHRRRPLFLLAFALPFFAFGQSDPKIEVKASEPGWEARLNDGKVLKLKLLEATLTLDTGLGVLKIPVGDVKRIEFGLRVNDADSKAIAAALADLIAGTTRQRESAKDALAEIGPKAIPAVVRALASAPKDAKSHLVQMRDRLHAQRPEKERDEELRDRDRVLTADGSVFLGTLGPESIRVKVGDDEKAFRFSEWKVLAFGNAEIEEKLEILALGNGIYALAQSHMNKVIGIEVTGRLNSSVWGTGSYTTDSDLATAAVHAGVLAINESGIVKIKIKPDVGGYTGSSANGVISGDWGPYQGGCYEILGKHKKKK